ncbi:uncharacterized protein LACBIDRAFT_295213 [Laccaria bicolor S238N-H82]|uniref:Predicted protein n=1 Tax=Laccaria bicolor (strain S238N-H82 / ATCC MYA-4686) TaxID=486041 RepID=B0DPF9_LACBS|nr:uncharacterized protein LACBIDRAFT_295213 [Laccaria bicolor S238N-H82]EDR03368.1 predicted protein [Laccaria bicolor S238N-H82]|eukprot:XP_001885824.1 predicted protein [Laccaria bicolor S238N-H82]
MDHLPPAVTQHPPPPEDDAWPTLLVLPFLVGQVAFLSVWVVSQLIYLISSACYKNPNENPRLSIIVLPVGLLLLITSVYHLRIYLRHARKLHLLAVGMYSMATLSIWAVLGLMMALEDWTHDGKRDTLVIVSLGIFQRTGWIYFFWILVSMLAFTATAFHRLGKPAARLNDSQSQLRTRLSSQITRTPDSHSVYAVLHAFTTIAGLVPNLT